MRKDELFSEVEFKYSAENVSLNDFKKYANDKNPVRRLSVGGYDHYFTKSETEFLRFRAGGIHEITIKRKLTDKNNFVRTELNLRIVPDLHTDDSIDDEKTLERVTKFADLLGYKPNFKIFKQCFIFYYDTHDVVYYIVYDANMRETNRFLEIEMLEHYPWESNDQAYQSLLKLEQELKPFGLVPQSRLRKSLFEMYRQPLV